MHQLRQTGPGDQPAVDRKLNFINVRCAATVRSGRVIWSCIRGSIPGNGHFDVLNAICGSCSHRTLSDIGKRCTAPQINSNAPNVITRAHLRTIWRFMSADTRANGPLSALNVIWALPVRVACGCMNGYTQANVPTNAINVTRRFRCRATSVAMWTWSIRKPSQMCTLTSFYSILLFLSFFKSLFLFLFYYIFIINVEKWNN